MALQLHHLRAQSVRPPYRLDTKLVEDPAVAAKTAAQQSTVSCVYQANIAGLWRTVTVLWSKNLMNHALALTVDSVSDGGGDHHYTCKIDLKAWHFWSKKASKSFQVDSGRPVHVYWDLRSARFSGTSPEPCADFYVALVCDEEVVLLLGDYKKKAFKKTKSRPALCDATLFCKKEVVFAKRSFVTRARLEERTKGENEILVESATSAAGALEPEMRISVDGNIVVHVRNLQWKFRGNQTVLVNRQEVQVFWDVHDWLFSSNPGNGAGQGLFIFKPGVLEPTSTTTSESEKDNSSSRGSSWSDADSCYHSVTEGYLSPTPKPCLFLYAWKIE